MSDDVHNNDPEDLDHSLEPLEEILVLDPENPNGAVTPEKSPLIFNTSDEDCPSLKCLVQNFQQSPVPFIILDKDLYIRWENESFYSLFSIKEHITGETLQRLFHFTSEEQGYVSVYKSLKDAGSGYSWKGTMEYHNRSNLTVISHLLIYPIFSNTGDEKELSGYSAVFDDITSDTREFLQKTFSSLLEASKQKDNDTGKHIERVNRYSKIIAESLYQENSSPEVTMEFVDNIGFLAAMHDVGKIGTPDDILNKEGPLEDWEWDIMQEHTKNGGYILSSYPNPMAKYIALYHHEKWDGSGYPWGISGTMIPLSARIVTISDVYDALRMKRSYKEPFSHEKTCSIINDGSGTHFDPELLVHFNRMHLHFEKIYEELRDTS